MKQRKRGSSVTIGDWATRWTTGIRFPAGAGTFYFATTSRPALRFIQPPIEWVAGALSPGAKRPGSEADHPPPYSSKVKNTWSYTSPSQYIFNAVFNWVQDVFVASYLVKQWHNFTFTRNRIRYWRERMIKEKNAQEKAVPIWPIWTD